MRAFGVKAEPLVVDKEKGNTVKLQRQEFRDGVRALSVNLIKERE